jgi:hypothetical protein
MSLYFVSVQQVMAKMLPEKDSSSRYKHAVMQYRRNKEIKEQDVNVRSKDMFVNWFWFLRNDGHLENESIDENVTIYNSSEYTFSRPLTEGFFFANVYRSVVLADMGVNSSDNILLNKPSLAYILNPDDDFNRETEYLLGGEKKGNWWRFNGLSDPSAPEHSADSAVPCRKP